ncbi:aminotransferase class I/II-fold pyridoxal phosphate-dependent enzyme [Domibacillus indicus]|nr:aminotransferase class I/II-fold pyridoxal phosphate-dependent enzyme [Domibacillus indicus]
MEPSKKPIYLSPPHMGGLEQRFIDEAFKQNWIAPAGPHIARFEEELAAYTGSGGAVALSSGTAGIHLALRALGLQKGDTVFCSSFTFVASANPIRYEGAEPVFIDSEPESWNMSPAALEQAFREAEQNNRLPKAVIVVHLYGQNADMDPIMKLCNTYDVPVIEDAAESLGSTYKGRASGTIGTFGIYSFNGNKIITTSNGGMIVSNDRDALEKIRFWSTQAKDNAGHYQHSELGYNYRLSNVLAGIGRGQLLVLNERISARQAIFNTYKKELSPLPGVRFMPETSYGTATHWLTALTLEEGRAKITPVQLIEALAQADIEARRVWKPMHAQPLYQHCKYVPHQPNLSVSDAVFKEGVCLPSGSSLTNEEQQRVIDCVKKALR